MFEEKLTEENAQILLNLYQLIFDEIKAYEKDLMAVHFAFARRMLPLKFRGCVITPKEFADIKKQFRARPERREKLIRPGASYKVVWPEIKSAWDFMENLPYSDFVPIIPEIDEANIRNRGKEEAG